MEKSAWYELVRSYTLELVKIRSVSPGPGETRLAHELLRLLREGRAEAGYTLSGLDALAGDRYGRQNVFAFIRGKRPETLVLLGHFDTVDTREYSELEELALDPERLTALSGVHERLTKGFEPFDSAQTEDWLFGRGVADMKSGVAVNLALIRHFAQLAAQQEPPPISLLFLATPDEENESAGVLQGLHLLARLRDEYNLSYTGLINTDYSTPRYPNDPQRYIYAGSIGKLLPCYLCLGREAHVGDPFKGLDANLLAAELIRELSMNPEWCDTVRSQMTSPPVTLHAADLKTHYDVQLPFATFFYLNFLTFSTTPAELLERLSQHARTVLETLVQRVEAAEQRWRTASGVPNAAAYPEPVVFTYAELYAQAVRLQGETHVRESLQDEAQRMPETLDSRERSLKLVQRLSLLAELKGPAIVIFYAPPYYPHVAAAPGPLQEAVEAVIAAHPQQHLVVQEYYPYLSDMSYFSLDAEIEPAALKANMPLWHDSQERPPQGGYSLPLDLIRSLNIPVINWGIHGRGAHQRDEGVLTSYTFSTLPQLLYETILHLGAL